MTTGSRFSAAKVFIATGLGFIGSNLARRLVQPGAEITLTDSVIPAHGGSQFNIHDIHDWVSINITPSRINERLPIWLEVVRAINELN